MQTAFKYSKAIWLDLTWPLLTSFRIKLLGSSAGWDLAVLKQQGFDYIKTIFKIYSVSKQFIKLISTSIRKSSIYVPDLKRGRF